MLDCSPARPLNKIRVIQIDVSARWRDSEDIPEQCVVYTLYRRMGETVSLNSIPFLN